jgi:hypothetical protein
MEQKRADLSPDDKAIIEQQIASALCYLYGDTVSERLPDEVMTLLEELATREPRRQHWLSGHRNDNEADDASLLQRALGCALQLSFERAAKEPLSSDIAFLLMRLALAELVKSINNESPPAQ